MMLSLSLNCSNAGSFIGRSRGFNSAQTKSTRISRRKTTDFILHLERHDKYIVLSPMMLRKRKEHVIGRRRDDDVVNLTGTQVE